MMLIKNNLKLILRCRPIILIVICMVLVTGMLSTVFEDMMTDSLDLENITVGCSFSENCVYAPIRPILEEICRDNGIELLSLADGSGQRAVESEKTVVFAEFTDDGCTVYSDSQHKIEAGVVEMIISSVLSSASGVQNGDYLIEYKMEVLPMPDSQLYYTIAYTVYFVWCAMVVLVIVASSERKNKISARFRTTPVSAVKIYLSRYVPGTIVIAGLMFVGAATCTLLFGIEWKEPLLTAAILLLGCAASAAFGTVLVSLVKNAILSVVLGFCIIMFWGFFGGSFCPYMWAPWADEIRDFSPVYYMTRSLVELNTSGSSEFTVPALLVLCGLSLVCVPMGMAAVKFGRES